MTKTIDTLVEDIYALFKHQHNVGNHSDFGEREYSIATAFGKRLADTVYRRIYASRSQPTLRLSNIGTQCSRKLWYSIKTPEDAEELSPATRIKFLFGDILEELLLFLAEEAGHVVEGRQDELDVNGVIGHRDAIIDGRLVDVKSASTYSFRKFATNGLRGDDPFGYLDQLNGYLRASLDDPKLKEKDVISFLVIDKTLGKICLDTYPANDVDYSKKIDNLRDMLSKDTPPERSFEDKPEGKSGNRTLDVHCSYCDFKHKCWPELRTFIYSDGPKFLTKVEREPKVPEVKDGVVIEKF